MESKKNQAKNYKKQTKKKVIHPTKGKVRYFPHEVKQDRDMSRVLAKELTGQGRGKYVAPLPKERPIAKLSFGTVDEKMLKIGSNTLNIKTSMEPDVLVEAMATYLSSLYYYNIPGSYADSIEENPTTVWEAAAAGAAYLGSGIQTLSKGATAEITRIPRIFDVMTQLLAERTVRLGAGIVRYSPQWVSDFSMPQSYTTPTGAVWTCAPPDSGGTIGITFSPVAPSSDSYSVLLRLSEQNKEFGSQVVSYNENKGLYTHDPSCYARVYSYFGTGGTPGIGCYNEVELEAPFQYPQFARFTNYNLDDKVISRIFHPTTGGINTAVGQTLVQPSNYSLLRNPIPAVYKFIDFYQVYTVLCSYLVNLFEQTFVTNGAPGYTPSTLPCTQIEFCTMLRQAILTQFPSQVHAQFVAPQASVPTQNASVFEPFIVDSVTAPSQAFANMLLPDFIHENLCMLKQASTEISSTPNSEKFKKPPKRLRHNFYPVWGVYSGDVPPEFRFRIDNTTYPLFTPEAPGDPSWRLWDGISDQNPNVKYNFNSGRFTEIVTQWNDWISRNKNKSTLINTISGDKGPGVNLLLYTRVLETIPTPTDTAGKHYQSPLYDNIVNKPRTEEVPSSAEMKKQKSLKKVQAVPPASYFDLYTQSIMSHQQMAMDYFGAVRYFILPEIRLDTQGTDAVTLAAYSVYTGEVCTVSNTMGTTPADNEVARLSITGQLMTAGAFAALPDNDVLSLASKELAVAGSGSDLIKSLLGGMASLIPGVGGVISSVIQGL